MTAGELIEQLSKYPHQAYVNMSYVNRCADEGNYVTSDDINKVVCLKDRGGNFLNLVSQTEIDYGLEECKDYL